MAEKPKSKRQAYLERRAEREKEKAAKVLDSCPRSWAHRKGTYCKTCERMVPE